jgi:hypothetical protein
MNFAEVVLAMVRCWRPESWKFEAYAERRESCLVGGALLP